jgi:cholinesterase
MLVGANHEERGRMICSSGEAAAARTKQGIPSWRYHFANDKSNSKKGAVHGEEVPLVFGNSDPLSPLFQTAWGVFVKDPESGLSRLGWPEYDPKGILGIDFSLFIHY